jgi:hypothetical protein
MQPNLRAKQNHACNNKFKGLKNCSKPTGEANCPWEVTEAKAIQRDMESKMATVHCDGVDMKLQQLFNCAACLRLRAGDGFPSIPCERRERISLRLL